MKKLVYISGTRADFGLMKRTLLEINKYVDLIIIVTGMHLSNKWGNTIKEIYKYNFKIKRVSMPLSGENLGDMVESFAFGFQNIFLAIKNINPDIIFLEGDRGEALIGAIIGSHLNIPIFHQGGGDISDSIDNKIRDAITMFSDYHLVGNEISYKRLINFGISEKHLFNVGEPGLDDILKNDYTQKTEIIKKYSINPNEPLILLIFHPNTKEIESVEAQTIQIMEAIKKLEINTIGLYANADAGGNLINKILANYKAELPYLKLFKHFYREDFLGLMNVCSLMIGNSSSGIIELPSFKKPFVCIGTRQKGRLKLENVLEVGYVKEDIFKAINKALYDEDFKNNIKQIKNPYGDGTAYLKITDIFLKNS